MKNKFEKLILLEFLVNKVEFYENEFNIDKYYLSRLGEICVQIKFKGCYILDIKEDENSRSEVGENGKRTVYMGAGKSCLLSVSQLMGNSNCEASISVSRKTPDGEAKEYYTFGEAKANLEPVFKVLQNSKCPPVKTMRGEFDIKDGQDTKIGSIELFVRATGLGKNIVTMFQLGAGESSFYFKGTEPTSEDDFDEESSSSVCKESRFEVVDPCAASQSKHLRPEMTRPPAIRDPYYPYKEGTTYTQPMAPSYPPWGAQPGYTAGFQGSPVQGFMPSPAVPGGMGGIGGVMGAMSGMGGMGVVGGPVVDPAIPGQAFMPAAPSYYQQPQTLYRDEDYEKLDGEYKEISAEVNGYEVKIKLLRRPKKNAVK